MIVNNNKTLIVNNISERNNISIKTKNMTVKVIDATLDQNTSGSAEYSWNGNSWVLINSETELLEKKYLDELNNRFINESSIQQSSNNTTLKDIDNLNFIALSNSYYRIEAFISFKSSVTTTGLKLGFLGPLNSNCFLEVEVPILNTSTSSQLRIIFPSSSNNSSGVVIGTGVSTANSIHTARISGIIKTNESGVFTLQFASENNGVISLPIGNILQVQKI